MRSSCSQETLPGDRNLIAEPLGKSIFFCGEHAHPTRYMVAHAAMETGAIAARAVLASMPAKAQQATAAGAGSSATPAAKEAVVPAAPRSML